MQLTGLDGARVVVTAGASGIGNVIAKSFADAGASVFTCDVDPGLVASLRASEPMIGATVADVASEEDVDRLFDEARARLGVWMSSSTTPGLGGRSTTSRTWRPRTGSAPST